jgi:hypothetical protein
MTSEISAAKCIVDASPVQAVGPNLGSCPLEIWSSAVNIGESCWRWVVMAMALEHSAILIIGLTIVLLTEHVAAPNLLRRPGRLAEAICLAVLVFGGGRLGFPKHQQLALSAVQLVRRTRRRWACAASSQLTTTAGRVLKWSTGYTGQPDSDPDFLADVRDTCAQRA